MVRLVSGRWFMGLGTRYNAGSESFDVGVKISEAIVLLQFDIRGSVRSNMGLVYSMWKGGTLWFPVKSTSEAICPSCLLPACFFPGP